MDARAGFLPVIFDVRGLGAGGAKALVLGSWILVMTSAVASEATARDGGAAKGSSMGELPMAIRGNEPRAEPREQIVVPRREEVKRFAAVFDVGLVPLGKIGGRFELAVTPLHAIYVEPSYIVRHIPDLNRSLSATEIDIGWHLFPQERGVDGFYFGPRAIFAATDVEEAKARAWGFGADVGYQWVIAGGPTLNIGAGIAYFHVVAQARPESIEIFRLLDPLYQQAISNATIHASGLMPLGMAGMGLAY